MRRSASVRPGHRPDVIDRHIVEIAEPADRADLFHVDEAVGQHRIVDMDAGHLAENHHVGPVAFLRLEAHAAEIAAFEMDRRFGDPRRLDGLRRRLGQAGMVELVDAGRHMLGGEVHRIAQVPSRHVADELAGRFGVGLGILGRVGLALAVRPRAGGEHDLRRRIAHRVEEGIGREIGRAVRRQAGDPADRPRHDQRVERVAGQAVMLVAGPVEHGGSELRRIGVRGSAAVLPQRQRPGKAGAALGRGRRGARCGTYRGYPAFVNSPLSPCRIPI